LTLDPDSKKETLEEMYQCLVLCKGLLETLKPIMSAVDHLGGTKYEQGFDTILRTIRLVLDKADGKPTRPIH